MALPESIPLRHKREAGDTLFQDLWKNIASFTVWQRGYMRGLSTVLASKQQWSGVCFGVRNGSEHQAKSSSYKLKPYFTGLSFGWILGGLESSCTHSCVESRRNGNTIADCGYEHSFPLQYPPVALALNTVTHFKKVIYYIGVMVDAWWLQTKLKHTAMGLSGRAMEGTLVWTGWNCCLHRAPSSGTQSG